MHLSLRVWIELGMFPSWFDEMTLAWIGWMPVDHVEVSEAIRAFQMSRIMQLQCFDEISLFPDRDLIFGTELKAAPHYGH